jgi:hypothetical protein
MGSGGGDEIRNNSLISLKRASGTSPPAAGKGCPAGLQRRPVLAHRERRPEENADQQADDEHDFRDDGKNGARKADPGQRAIITDPRFQEFAEAVMASDYYGLNGSAGCAYL